MGAVLVHIDCDGDRPHPASLKALAAGRVVASSWGATLYAAVIVHDPDEQRATLDAASRRALHHAATPAMGTPRRRATTAGLSASAPADPGSVTAALHEAIGRAGADKLVVVLSDRIVTPLWASVGDAWQTVLDQLRPRLVLFGADAPSAAELGPRTGARIGARMLLRARPLGHDLVELRDRDGGYVRAADSGAAVVLVGTAPRVPVGDGNIDVVLLVSTATPEARERAQRVELAGTGTAELAHTSGAIVAIGDELLGDATVVGHARQLAAMLDAHVVGSAATVRAGVVAPGAVVERGTPLAPSLCIALGNANVDLAGATSLVRVSTGAGKGVDAALVGPVAANLGDLVAALAALEALA